MGKKPRTTRKKESTKSGSVDLAQVQRLVENAELVLIRLRHIEAGMGPTFKPDQLPDNVNQIINIEVRRQTNQNSIVSRCSLAVHAMYGQPESEELSKEEIPVFVHATFEAFFKVPTESPFDDEHLDAFGRHIGLLSVWPYWREIVQSTTNKMGLPSIIIPLFKVL